MHFEAYSKLDIQKIRHVFKSSFSDSEGAEEGAAIDSLVSDLVETTSDQDVYGFVAKQGDEFIGGVFFTRLRFESGQCVFMLSPLAVATSAQQKRCGQGLVNFALKHLKDKSVEFAFTYGDPNYYSRFGFKHIDPAIAIAPFALSQPEGWLGVSLNGEELSQVNGQSYCVEAFNNPSMW